MSTLRNPVGPQPPRVYWRRRLIVLLGLLAVIVVIVLIVVRPGASSGNEGAGPDPEPSTSETAAPPEEDAEVVPCTAEMISLEAVTDADNYDPVTSPQLSLTITNTGTNPCTMAAGSDVQEYRITSGTETIWSSKDCQTEPQPATVELAPGESRTGGPITWDRTRSTPDTCETPREPVVAGGASYHLSVFVGDFQSEQTRQFVLQ